MSLVLPFLPKKVYQSEPETSNTRTLTTESLTTNESKDMTNEMTLFGNTGMAVPAYAQQDQGAGNENVGQDDQTIPRINLLQAISPQLEDLEDAKAGMFHNSVTDELYSEIYVTNLFYSKSYAVFKKRATGGGFEGDFPTRVEAHAHAMTLPGNADDYEIIETGKHACLMLDPKSGAIVQPVLIYLANSMFQFSKKWNTEIELQGQGAARFATVWRLFSVNKKNNKGQSWKGWDAEFIGWLPEEPYLEAKQAYEGIREQI